MPKNNKPRTKTERLDVRLTPGEKAAYQQAVRCFGAGAVIGVCIAAVREMLKGAGNAEEKAGNPGHRSE